MSFQFFLILLHDNNRTGGVGGGVKGVWNMRSLSPFLCNLFAKKDIMYSLKIWQTCLVRFTPSPHKPYPSPQPPSPSFHFCPTLKLITIFYVYIFINLELIFVHIYSTTVYIDVIIRFSFSTRFFL